MIRVLLVDDDPMVCTGVQSILELTDDLAVIGSVHDGDEVRAAVRELKPDVVVMDIKMARTDGIAAAAELARLPAGPPVLMLTVLVDNAAMLRSIQAHATGFLLKTARPRQIIEAVRAVAVGDSYMSDASLAALLEFSRSDPVHRRRVNAATVVATLTERERAVAVCVGRHLTNPQIAAELHLSESTVKSHLQHVQAKLDATNRVAVGQIVDRAGLLD